MKKTKTNHDRLPKMVSPLLQWYDHHARILPWRENPEPYAVWISEIMLQQTRVEAVKPYFERWMKALPDLPTLANAPESVVLKLWEGLGYYSRVKNIHKAAKLVMEKYDGILPSSYDALRSLPGIGEYSAGSVGSIAFQLPVPCVDGNVLRVVTRLTVEEADITTTSAKRLITDWVSAIIPKDRPGDFNQAMMELGATVCLPNGQPKCSDCPVAFLCEAHLQNRIADFPVKSAKQPRKKEKKTVLILLKGKKVALRKRPETGLLAGLWEFPNFAGELSEAQVREIIDSAGMCPDSLVPLKKAKHIFTHIEWEMYGYLAVANDADKKAAHDFEWVSADLLSDSLTLPSAFKTFYQVMQTTLNIRNDWGIRINE